MVTLIPVLSEKYSHNFMYQLLAACIWLSPRTPVSSTNKFYHDNISMMLSKSNLLFHWGFFFGGGGVICFCYDKFIVLPTLQREQSQMDALETNVCLFVWRIYEKKMHTAIWSTIPQIAIT